ncbi:hypothetical protein [Nocardia pseudovaccinii]|uniref:hypothetical protein n=1 Tax=Nocardia pseudovaccinii TaxID=189540 RepID=UPI0007A493AE|nr:hypothetical protein [Nocardia pseudovaccinii]
MDPETAWSPQSCPFRVAVTRLRVTDTCGQVHHRDIDSRNARGQRLLAAVRMAALTDPRVLSTYDGLLDDKQLRHPDDDCPLCALHHRPGPRVWGRWITDSWQGHPRYADHTSGGRPIHSHVELFGNLDHARETMTALGRVITDARPDSVRSSWEIGDLHAWTDTDPDYRNRLVSSTSQLWVWRRPPREWWPELVFAFAPDWSITETTGAELRRRHTTGRIFSGVLGDPPPAGAPETIQLDGLTVRCTGGGRDLRVISIHDTTSVAPARRILPDGHTTPLPDTVAGLTVYGRWEGERPALDWLTELTPEYAPHLAAIRQRLAAVGR